MLFNRITALICGIIVYTITAAQVKQPKVKFGDITPADFKTDIYTIDSSADAVYLLNVGSARYEYDRGFSIIYQVHKCIRLLHKKSFANVATIEIPLYKFNYIEDDLQNFQAVTYTYENGKVITTKVDKNSIFKDKEGDARIVKFTFPNLNEGCIIEYSYTKVMSNYTNLPRWNFQGDYPELWNEYTVEIPEYLDFVVLNKGYLIPVVDTIVQSHENYFNTTTIKHTWAFKNVPALKNESYVTDLSNYRQSIEFQVSALKIHGKETQYFMHTWYETVDELMKNESFGAELNKENGWLKDDVKAVVGSETDALLKAKKIYEFVQGSYTCTYNSAIYLSQPLKKTQQAKKGNEADINMLVIAMLKVAGFITNPVLLSTRSHGKTVDIYPIMSKFNYVIAQVDIGNDFYLLDASDPILGFGHLSAECYNGNARQIALMPNLINLSADSLHESELASLFLYNDGNGNVSGTYKNIMGEMQSIAMREKMKKSTAEEYFKDAKKSFSFDVDLKNAIIDSLKQPELPVSVQYEFSFKPEGNVFYLNPLISVDADKENPFNAAKRLYPVEMPYCADKTYIMNMEVPAGYQVDELPASAKITLNENEGMFEYLMQKDGDHIQLRCRTKLNKATFEPDDYETLRKFFAFVVEKESEQIVFKKL